MNMEEIAVQIIANAGDAKGSFLIAIDEAEAGNYEEAERLCADGNEKLLIAHQAHTQILVAEARQEKFELTFLVIHASEHLAVADFAQDMAERIIKIHRKIDQKN